MLGRKNFRNTNFFANERKVIASFVYWNDDIFPISEREGTDGLEQVV